MKQNHLYLMLVFWFLGFVWINWSNADLGETAVSVELVDEGLVPLPELGSGTYLGFEGGLYPNGSNSLPAAYAVEVGAAYESLLADDDIHFLCIGMSNLEQTCDAMIGEVDGQMAANVTIGNGGRPGRAIQAWDKGNVQNIYTDIGRSGFAPHEVDVVIFFNACARPATAYCGDMFTMQQSIENVYNSINQYYPNVKLIYFTSREYAPPEAFDLNPNPYAYQDGFSYKWAIEERINGNLQGAPVVWGPYQYDPDWPLSYFRDGDWVHLSSEGLAVAGALWYAFFLGEPWFGNAAIPPTATPEITITPMETAVSSPMPTAETTPTIEATETAVFTPTPTPGNVCPPWASNCVGPTITPRRR